MTDDLQTLLDHASASVPSVFDTDNVVARGRGRARRRRFGLAGGAVCGVAAATVAILTLTSTLVAGVGAKPPVSAGQPRPDYTLPQIDPSVDSYWSSSARTDDAASAQLTAAVVDYVTTHFSAAKVIRGEATLVAPDDEGSPFRVSRYNNRLFVLTEVSPGIRGVVVHEEPVYRLWNHGAVSASDDHDLTLDSLAGAQLAFDGSGQDQTDFLRLALYPSGGYQVGADPAKWGARRPSGGYLVEGCETYDITDAHTGTDDDRRFSFQCSDSTGPNGEQIIAVAAKVTYLSANVSFTINTVVVYRTDGTAVVVGDTPRPPVDWKQGTGSVSGTPALSLAALTGLALAVPLVPFA